MLVPAGGGSELLDDAVELPPWPGLVVTAVRIEAVPVGVVLVDRVLVGRLAGAAVAGGGFAGAGVARRVPDPINGGS